MLRFIYLYLYLLNHEILVGIKFTPAQHSLVKTTFYLTDTTLPRSLTLTMSPTASLQSNKSLPPLQTVDEYEDAEKNFRPKSLKFWTIIIGIYLYIFLVAFVSFRRVQLQIYMSSLQCQ